MTGTIPVPGATDGAPTPEPPVRPRLRVAAIVWGVILAALGAGVAWFVLDPERVDGAIGWALRAAPGAWGAVGVGAVLVVGLIILIGSVLAAVHRAQDRSGARRPE